MLAENIVPPIPSELIMPLAGFAAARGELSVVLVVVAGTLGSLAGALFWYHVGRRLGLRLRRFASRHGRLLTPSPDDIDRAHGWFERHGAKAVSFGRLVPTVRTLISVPGGINGTPLPSFLAWSTLGTGLWTAALAGAGYLLQSQYGRVADYLNVVSTGVVVLAVAWYLYRVATFRAKALRGVRRASLSPNVWH